MKLKERSEEKRSVKKQSNEEKNEGDQLTAD